MFCVVAALPLSAAVAADKEPAPDKTGLKVGDKAPAFTLKDQSGKERSLDEFVKTGKVAIVFYRSAAW
ncbi:MAG TPA: hypothetical protein VKD71_09745 [Gemmataceae bacterium]|nr:hypothetical protein [Gemmataceae bacterium]